MDEARLGILTDFCGVCVLSLAIINIYLMIQTSFLGSKEITMILSMLRNIQLVNIQKYFHVKKLRNQKFFCLNKKE